MKITAEDLKSYERIHKALTYFVGWCDTIRVEGDNYTYDGSDTEEYPIEWIIGLDSSSLEDAHAFGDLVRARRVRIKAEEKARQEAFLADAAAKQLANERQTYLNLKAKFEGETE